MPSETISPRSVALFRALAGEQADAYLEDIFIPSFAEACNIDAPTIPQIRQWIANPHRCLRTIFQLYAFSRRGKDRAELAASALEALDSVTSEERFSEFLGLKDGMCLWNAFEKVCERKGKKPNEQLNRGVIAGLAELAQEIYRLDGLGSIAEWIAHGVIRTERLEPRFLRIVDVRGVGPKLASLLLRDVVFLYGLEDRLAPIDRIYVQPLDKHLRRLAPLVIDEPGIEEAADWVLAGKLSKYARKSGVSGIRFNMGASYLGMRSGTSTGQIADALDRLL